MKQVTFYILSQSSDNTPNRVEQLTCDLAAQHWRMGKKVLIACETEQQAFAIDDLLWARNPDDFVPHNLSGESTPYPTPIEISWAGKRNAQHRDLLISLQRKIPDFVASFNQVIDFVPTNEEEKAIARERYKQYRQMGWQLGTENA